LYLLDLYQYTKDDSLLHTASQAGYFLLSQGVAARGGLKWFWSGKSGIEMPNYAEGTSGVAYFLATLYSLTKDNAFLGGAVAGATYLQAVANTANDGCIIFHSSMSPTLFYLANCNGNSGTGRLWHRLYQVTGNSTWLKWAGMTAKSIVDHGKKFNWVFHLDHEDALWNNVGLCDGSAAIIAYMTYQYQVTGRADIWAFTEAVAADMLKRATVDGNGLKWVTVEWRTNPGISTGPQVGYMQGNAGIGSTLLELDAVINKKSSVRVAMPDSPYNFGFVPKP